VIRLAAAATPRAARVTACVLAAAWLRTAVEPWLGTGPSTLLFGGCLLAVLLENRPARRLGGERCWPWLRTGVAGLGLGLLLLGPLVGQGPGAGRPLDTFWVWGASAAAIASLEEAVLRGTLQDAWTREAGVPAGLVASALVFALIHVPHYGLATLPLDAAAGLCLAGLRLATGRLVGCVVAHILADWGAWFLG
jgi:membrane protease YdiL (CAAX protease family)